MLSQEDLLQTLLSLSHRLGDPSRTWAILGEGNTSVRVDNDTFLVKSSGSSLRTLSAAQVAPVRFAPILAALESAEELSDTAVKDLLFASVTDGVSAGLKPSVETLLHAFLLSLPGVEFVGHTHPASVNSLLCSGPGWEAVKAGGRLFPDEIVVCGIAPCCVPYVDPGLPLARAVRSAVRAYSDTHGVSPKTIYLQSHGFIALGKTGAEVEAIHQMADKAASVLLGTFAAGGPAFLSEAVIQRIYTRPDEHFRQKALGLAADGPA